jgi:hypothetical protein
MARFSFVFVAWVSNVAILGFTKKGWRGEKGKEKKGANTLKQTSNDK